MKKILKNQHEERIALKNDELNDAHLSTKIEQQINKANKPYSKQWKDWYIGTKLFSYIANIFSSLTQCFALFMFATATITGTPALLGIGILSVVLALLIEYLKRSAVDKFMFSAVWQKDFKGGTITKWLFMSLISVGASFYACTQLPKTYTQIANPIPPVDTAAVVAIYQKQIATQEKVLESQRSERKSDGRLRYGVSAKIDKTNERIDSLYKAQGDALLSATQAYQKAVDEKANKDESIGNLLAYCSIGLEVLFALALWYESKYLYNCALERNLLTEDDTIKTPKIEPTPVEPPTPINADTGHIAPTPSARKPIGFEIPQKQVEELPTPSRGIEVNTPIKSKNGDRSDGDRSTTITIREIKSNERECAHCKKVFKYKHWNAKYCSDECRKKAWELRRGDKLNSRRSKA